MENKNILNKFQEIIDVCNKCINTETYDVLKQEICYFDNLKYELFNFVRAEEANENLIKMGNFSKQLIKLEITSEFFPRLWEGETEDGHSFYARFKRDLFYAGIDDTEIFRKDRIFYPNDREMTTKEMLILVGFTTTPDLLKKCTGYENRRITFSENEEEMMKEHLALINRMIKLKSKRNKEK